MNLPSLRRNKPAVSVTPANLGNDLYRRMIEQQNKMVFPPGVHEYLLKQAAEKSAAFRAEQGQQAEAAAATSNPNLDVQAESEDLSLPETVIR